MIVRGYGIELHRLTEDKIEMVRQWRNSDIIQKHMQYRKQITQDMQKKWFASVNNIENNYMLIKVKDEFIGVINGAKINWDNMITGSGGIFIGELDYWSTSHPIAASLLLTDISALLGFLSTKVEVIKSNKRAIAYNKFLGYELIEESDDGVLSMELKMTNYEIKRNLIRDLYFSQFESYIPEIIIDNKHNPIESFYLPKLETLDQTNQINLKIL